MPSRSSRGSSGSSGIPCRSPARTARTPGAARRGRDADFPAATADVRDAEWRVAEAPRDLHDRRVEITGPAEPKMMINALNSRRAACSWPTSRTRSSPTWSNVVGGQAALADAVRRTLTFDAPDGKAYRLDDEIATLLVRPRGWHLPRTHVLVDGAPISAQPVRLRPVPLPQRRARSCERGSRAVLLPAQAREPPRGAPLERRLRRAQDALGHPARARSARPC